jgi:protein SCO1
MSPRTLLAWRSAAVACATGLCAVIAYATWHVSPDIGPTWVSGTADVGGPFTLMDTSGRPVSDRDFRGRTVIIYFGWRLDPDLTPAALQILSSAMERIGPKSGRLAALFISLDAERDTPRQLFDFTEKIDARIIPLIGSTEQTTALAKAFKLYFKTLPDPTLPQGYSIDHASLYYVMGSDGAFLGVVPHTTDSAALARELNRLMK